MKCMNCNKNEASVYVEQNINGKITKLALCPHCAQQHGIGSGSLLGGFNLLGNLFDFPIITDTRKQNVKKCPECSRVFDDIVSDGMVGCSKCYEVFASELAPTVRKIHGNVHHIGRRLANRKTNDAEETVNTEPTDTPAILRKELEEAIRTEEYEKAAEIRDRIRAVEAKGKEQGTDE